MKTHDIDSFCIFGFIRHVFCIFKLINRVCRAVSVVLKCNSIESPSWDSQRLGYLPK